MTSPVQALVGETTSDGANLPGLSPPGLSHEQEPSRSRVLERRESYKRGFQDLIEPDRSKGRVDVPSARLASSTISDMGIGGATWSRGDGSLGEEQVTGHYGTMALRLVEA